MTSPSIRKIVRVQDLVPDDQLWADYELAHSVGHTPAAVLEAQKRHGILDLEIYRYADRLVMILTVTDAYDPAGLEAESAVVPDLIEWHTRMNALQRRPAPAQENWPEAHCVFRQSDHP